MPLRVLALLALAGVTVAGCEEYRARRDGITFEHGNAIAHNIAVQTIDPWPPNVGDSRIDVDGRRLLIAAERYKDNKSIPPRGLTTQGISVTPVGPLSPNSASP